MGTQEDKKEVVSFSLWLVDVLYGGFYSIALWEWPRYLWGLRKRWWQWYKSVPVLYCSPAVSWVACRWRSFFEMVWRSLSVAALHCPKKSAPFYGFKACLSFTSVIRDDLSLTSKTLLFTQFLLPMRGQLYLSDIWQGIFYLIHAFDFLVEGGIWLFMLEKECQCLFAKLPLPW